MLAGHLVVVLHFSNPDLHCLVMPESQTLSWLPYIPPADIKVEPPAEFSLLSPPTSPFPSPSFTTTSLCRRRSSSFASPKRVRPYPSLPRERRSRVEDSEKMATGPPYGNWSKAGSSSGRLTERRSSDGDQPLLYGASSFTNAPVCFSIIDI